MVNFNHITLDIKQRRMMGVAFSTKLINFTISRQLLRNKSVTYTISVLIKFIPVLKIDKNFP